MNVIMLSVRCKLGPRIGIKTPGKVLILDKSKTHIFGNTAPSIGLGINVIRSFTSAVLSKKAQQVIQLAKTGKNINAVIAYEGLAQNETPKEPQFYEQILPFCKNDPKFALRLWNDMRKVSVTPTQQTISSLVKICFNSQNFRLTESVIKGCDELGIIPDKADCFSLLRTCRPNESKRAMEMLHYISKWKVSPSIGFYKSLIGVVKSHGSPEDAKRLNELLNPDMKQILSGQLLTLFRKTGLHKQAEEIFADVPNKTVEHFNTMITIGASRSYKEAYKYYEQMLDNSILPDVITISSMLDCCRQWNIVQDGFDFLNIIKQSQHLQSNPVIQTSIMEFLIFTVGDTAQIEAALAQIPNPIPAVWGLLIQHYIKTRNYQKALLCFEHSDPNHMEDYLRALEAAQQLNSLEEVKKIHKKAKKYLSPLPDRLVCQLIRTYGVLKNIPLALATFEISQFKTVQNFSAIIQVLSGNDYEAAMKMLLRMREETDINHYSAEPVLLKMIQTAPNLQYATDLWKLLKELPLFLQYPQIGFQFISLFGRLHQPKLADEVFKSVQNKNKHHCHKIIKVLITHDQPEEAKQIFKDLETQNIKPLRATVLTILDTCTDAAEVPEMLSKLDEDLSQMTPDSQPQLYSKLLNTLGRLDIEQASSLFNQHQNNNVVHYNIMMDKYINKNQTEKAMAVWKDIKQKFPLNDPITLMQVMRLAVMSNNQALGEEAFKIMLKFNINHTKANAEALFMFSHWGKLELATKLLEQLPHATAAEWTAVLHGYTSRCQGELAWKHYEKMRKAGVKPTLKTFLNLRMVMNHCRMYDKAEKVLLDFQQQGVETPESMLLDVVYFMSRAHHFDKAEQLAARIGGTRPWMQILYACKHAVIEKTLPLGQITAQVERTTSQVILTEDFPSHAAAYDVLAFVYRAGQNKERADEAQKKANQIQAQVQSVEVATQHPTKVQGANETLAEQQQSQLSNTQTSTM